MVDATMDRFGESSRIVIVENEDDDFFMMTYLLQKAGLRNPITRFSSGGDAIRYLKRTVRSGRLPRLMFVDIKMPGLSGFDVLAWIRGQPMLAEIKVVILSASDDERDLRVSEALGADRYLTKFPSSDILRPLISEMATL